MNPLKPRLVSSSNLTPPSGSKIRTRKPKAHRKHGKLLSADDPEELFRRLVLMIPTLPKDRKVSKLEILQAAIRYIQELESRLERHPEAENLCTGLQKVKLAIHCRNVSLHGAQWRLADKLFFSGGCSLLVNYSQKLLWFFFEILQFYPIVYGVRQILNSLLLDSDVRKKDDLYLFVIAPSTYGFWCASHGLSYKWIVKLVAVNKDTCLCICVALNSGHTYTFLREKGSRIWDHDREKKWQKLWVTETALIPNRPEWDEQQILEN